MTYWGYRNIPQVYLDCFLERLILKIYLLYKTNSELSCTHSCCQILGVVGEGYVSNPISSISERLRCLVLQCNGVKNPDRSIHKPHSCIEIPFISLLSPQNLEGTIKYHNQWLIFFFTVEILTNYLYRLLWDHKYSIESYCSCQIAWRPSLVCYGRKIPF